MPTSIIPRALRQLAADFDVQTAYTDVGGQRRQASIEALVAVLQALGAQLTGPDDAAEALRERRRELLSRAVPPVVVARVGEAAAVELHTRAQASGSLDAQLTLESGEERQWSIVLGAAHPLRTLSLEDEDWVSRRIMLPEALPPGYHWLHIEGSGTRGDTLVVSAPPTTYVPARSEDRIWGVFLPVYALQSNESWGSGDFTDLR
ncbi:MAG TPA: 4-alpha-glucanotransferase, partial [Dehalococcoidia bacterium]|nr:4-alpha-glucanotransferase [Dehalococcoidia bacterium]